LDYIYYHNENVRKKWLVTTKKVKIRKKSEKVESVEECGSTHNKLHKLSPTSSTRHINGLGNVLLTPAFDGKYRDKEIATVWENAYTKGITVWVPLPDPDRKDFTYLGELVMQKDKDTVLTLSARVPNGTAREKFIQATATLFSRLWRS